MRGIDTERKRKKKTIAEYISLRFIGITVATAILMTLFITYFSNIAMEYDIGAQIRRESKYDYLNVTCRNGEIQVSDQFVYEADGVIKVVLDEKNNLIAGNYPIKELAAHPLNYGTVEKVAYGKEVYYIYDRSIINKDQDQNWEMAAVVRTIVNKNNVSSVYHSLKYVSYICAIIIVVISMVIASFFSRHIVEPIHDICETAEKIGQDKDLSQRIEYNGVFKEIDILSQANNRMLDRLEEIIEKQKQFTSDVAHELRTPIAVVMAECQYARKHIHDKEEFDEAITLIERQVKKTNSIIMQLLQLSRLDQDRIQIDFEFADIQDIVEQVCENEKLKDTKNIHIRLFMEKAEAYVDVSLIMVVIRNLINNAIKYSHEGGKIDVFLKKQDKKIEFVVRDYGQGMSEIDRKHIFDRFYRTDKARNSEGFGLGLAICDRIVEIHRGKILVESKEGEGSVFRVILPEKP